MTQRFTIPGRLSGLNEYTLANRGNKYAGNKLKRTEQEVILWAIKAARLEPVTCPVKLLYRWVELDRRRDLDNIAFAAKYVQDALVEAGILAGDGWQHVIAFRHDFSVDMLNPRVEVEIQEV
jgi:Endodeoxyribonuclease RusA.